MIGMAVGALIMAVACFNIEEEKSLASVANQPFTAALVFGAVLFLLGYLKDDG